MRLSVLLLVVAIVLVSGCSDDTTSPPADGDISDGDTITDGDLSDGDLPDGDHADGDQSDGDLPDGDNPDGDFSDGDLPDGDSPDGDQSDGDIPDGDQADGDSSVVMPDGLTGGRWVSAGGRVQSSEYQLHFSFAPAPLMLQAQSDQYRLQFKPLIMPQQ